MADMILLLAAVVKITTSDIEGEVQKSRQRVAQSNSMYGSLDKADKADKTKFDNVALEGDTNKVDERSGVEETQQESDEEESLIEEDSSRTRSDNDEEINREVKKVLGLFLISWVLFVCLVSVSFLRG